MQPFDVEKIKSDFPLISTNPTLSYLDNASTTQKPRAVIDAVRTYYESDNANIHRGIHTLSQRATEQYEDVREKIKDFIHATSAKEIVFVRGATEAINLVAATYARDHVAEGDEILISGMEHHSNIVPWQMRCDDKKAHLKVIPVTDTGELDLDTFGAMLSDNTKLVALVHVSNTLGTVNPIKEMIALAHERNIPVLIDGAQAAPHIKIDVQDLDCDFYVFSGHKMYGPTGIGVLYAKHHLLDAMRPYQGGGDMITSVSFEKTTYANAPQKFEAGTPNIAGVIGLGAAIDYLTGVGFTSLAAHEEKLLRYATDQLTPLLSLKIIGNAKNKTAVISFVIDNIHPHDIGTFLDKQGVAVRTGHHCTMPLMDRFNVPATVRASFGMYNTKKDVDRLIKGLHAAIKFFI